MCSMIAGPSSREFMHRVREYQVPRHAIAIWTLGQNGFLLKSPEGTVVALDPYLSDYCTTFNATYGLDCRRVLPVFIEPEDLWVDLVLLTHSHEDHTDPETIRRFTRKDQARFIASWQAWCLLAPWGVPVGCSFLIHPLQTLEFRDLKVMGTWCIPTDSSDLNHLGFVVEFANGIKFYNTGDTAFHELLSHIKKMEPHVMTVCINSGFNNLGPWDAARTVKLIEPKVAIPAHFDMLVCNQQNPDLFRDSLKIQASAAQYVRLTYYEPYVFAV